MLTNTRYLIRRLQTRFIEMEAKGKHFPVVVDIGVGAAPHKKFIAHDRYIGVDIEDRGGVPDLLVEDINNGLSLPDNTADLVLCTEVLEHTMNPHLVVRELGRITKKGGTVLLTAPMVWPLHEVPNDHFRFTQYGAEYLFREAGFADVRAVGSNGYCYTMLELHLIHKQHWIFSPITLLVNISATWSGNTKKTDHSRWVFRYAQSNNDQLTQKFFAFA